MQYFKNMKYRIISTLFVLDIFVGALVLVPGRIVRLQAYDPTAMVSPHYQGCDKR